MDPVPDPLTATRAELVQHARQHGYLDHKRWQAVLARLATHGASPAGSDALRTDLAHLAAEEGWVFADEAPPASEARRREALLAKARRQASRVPVITHGYLSALLALARTWAVAHEALAQELARASVAERWPADWELACAMEGLLGAEHAQRRLAHAREQAQAEFERRGQKGWLDARDQLDLYVGLREHGMADDEARAVLVGLHAAADARRWACWGTWPAVGPTHDQLELLVEKVAQQARRAGRVGEGFRRALLGEAAVAGIDEARLLDAVAARCAREQWPATFDRRWQLSRQGPAPWWQRAASDIWRPAVGIGHWVAPAQRLSPLAPSALRMAPVLVVLLAALTATRPVAAPRPTASPVFVAAALATPIPPPVVPSPTPAPTPAPEPVLIVAHTDGLGARLRTAPATGPVVRLLGEGTAVVVIGADAQVDGTDWKRVQAPDGMPGWMAADLLQPAAPEPRGAG